MKLFVLMGLAVLVGLMAKPADAKPLAEPLLPHLHELTPVVTNVAPESREYIILQQTVLDINNLLKEPVLELHSERVPAKYIFMPHIEGVVFLANSVLSDVLDLFRPGLLGFVSFVMHPLKENRIISPVAVIDKDLPDGVLADVTKHEMLHFIGVPHVGDADDLMYPKYNPESLRHIGIYTKVELWARYELRQDIEDEVLDYLNQMAKDILEPKVPPHDELIGHTCSGGHSAQKK